MFTGFAEIIPKPRSTEQLHARRRYETITCSTECATRERYITVDMMMLAPWPDDIEIEGIGCLDEQVDWAAIVEQDHCSPSAGGIQE
jgi:hypothetical protein